MKAFKKKVPVTFQLISFFILFLGLILVLFALKYINLDIRSQAVRPSQIAGSRQTGFRSTPTNFSYTDSFDSDKGWVPNDERDSLPCVYTFPGFLKISCTSGQTSLGYPKNISVFPAANNVKEPQMQADFQRVGATDEINLRTYFGFYLKKAYTGIDRKYIQIRVEPDSHRVCIRKFSANVFVPIACVEYAASLLTNGYNTLLVKISKKDIAVTLNGSPIGSVPLTADTYLSDINNGMYKAGIYIVSYSPSNTKFEVDVDNFSLISQ